MIAMTRAEIGLDMVLLGGGKRSLTPRAPDVRQAGVIIGQLPVPAAGNANRWADSPERKSWVIDIGLFGAISSVVFIAKI